MKGILKLVHKYRKKKFLNANVFPPKKEKKKNQENNINNAQ